MRVEACVAWGRGWQQKTLCVPPRREASARATLKGRRSTAFFCRVRAARSGGGPKAQRAGPAVLRTARTPHPFTTPHSARFVLGAPPPRRYGVAAPEDSDLKIAPPKAQPSSSPRVSLTAAPLSLRRCRSAPESWTCLLLNSPEAILVGLAKCQPAEYALLSGRATNSCAKSIFSRALEERGFGYGRRLPSGRAGPACPRWATGSLYPTLFTRRGKSCQNVQAHFDDFPI